MQRIALLLLCASLPGHAGDFYQWRDADGVLHFSDVPPPTAAAEPWVPGVSNVVEAWRSPIPPRPPTRPPARSAQARGLAVEARRAREEQRAEKCHKARQRLNEVRAKRRAGYKASEGRRLRQRADRYQQDVRFYCGSWR